MYKTTLKDLPKVKDKPSPDWLVEVGSDGGGVWWQISIQNDPSLGFWRGHLKDPKTIADGITKAMAKNSGHS